MWKPKNQTRVESPSKVWLMRLFASFSVNPISASHVISRCWQCSKYLSVLMKHNAVIRIHDDTGSGVNSGDRLIHPMQGNQGQQRRNGAALGRTCLGGKELAILP